MQVIYYNENVQWCTKRINHCSYIHISYTQWQQLNVRHQSICILRIIFKHAHHQSYLHFKGLFSR